MANTSAARKIERPQGEIQFVDLQAQRARIGDAMDKAVLNAIHEGKYILGPQVTQIEKDLSAFCGAKHVITCANGTDSLGLYLMAKGVKKGDAVFVPAFTFVATAEVVAWSDATPFFVDIDADTFNICPRSLEKAIGEAKQQGLNPSGIIAVDLFGLPADYPAIEKIAAANDLWVMSDAAQAFGGSINGRKTGTFGDVTSTSFFPAKPLGCYGDGGALMTDDDAMADLLRSLRFHGKGEDKYDNVRIGTNSRLDTVQAAILIEKLKIFADELEARQKVADRYTAGLSDIVKTPVLPEGYTTAWAQYTLTLPEGANRDAIINACKAEGVPTMVYYPIPLSKQKGYAHYPSVSGGVPVSEDLAQRVLSLPMHPYLDESTQDYIIDVVRKALSYV